MEKEKYNDEEQKHIKKCEKYRQEFIDFIKKRDNKNNIYINKK